MALPISGKLMRVWRRARDTQIILATLTVRVRRRVRRDTTISLDGRDFELDQGFLAGRVVTVAYSLVGDDTPWVEHDSKRFALRPVDALANAKKKRHRNERPSPPSVPFDPAGALVERAAGRPPRHRED